MLFYVHYVYCEQNEVENLVMRILINFRKKGDLTSELRHLYVCAKQRITVVCLQSSESLVHMKGRLSFRSIKSC